MGEGALYAPFPIRVLMGRCLVAYKMLTPKELLAQTLAQAQKMRTSGYVDPNASKVPTNTPAAVAPTSLVDLPGSGGAYDKAMLASIFGTGGAATTPVSSTAATTAPIYTAPAYTAPTYTPINIPAAAYTAPDATPPVYTAPAYTPVNVPPPAYTEPDMAAPAYTAPTYKDIAIPTPAYTNPSGGPLMDAANAAFAEYQKSATGAANNVLDAQMAQANSIINSGGIWATLQPIADKQMQDSIAALGQISAVAKGNVEASRTALNVQEAADYDEVIKSIDTSIVAARHRTNDEMNQRGMFFSTVLDAAMGTVEAAGTTQKGQAAQQNKASLAKIAADMAVMSANIEIETIKGNASAVAQYTASMLQVVTQDATTKQTAQALVASLNVQKAGVVDAVAAQVFATGEQLKATAFGQQSQINADAANAANTKFSQEGQLSTMAFNQQVQQNTDAANAAITKFSQQVQINLDKANAQASAFNQQGQLSTMAFNQQVQQNNDAANASITKFSQQAQLNLDAANAQITAFNQQGQLSTQAFNQQVQQNNDAANASITAFNQQAQLRGEATNAAQQAYANTTDAANTKFTQNLQTNAATADKTTAAQNEFVNTMGQYANDYRAAANALDPNDPLYAFKEGMLESARNQKVQATTQAQATAILEAAKSKAAAAQQTFDNLLSAAKVDISAATQQATAAYQSGQLNTSQYNAATSRMNANTNAYQASTSRYNATKPAAGGAGSVSGSGLTYTQANGVIDDYTKFQSTLGDYRQEGGKYYGYIPNPGNLKDAFTGKPDSYVWSEVDVTTLKQQIAELEPVYRAAIAVRDKTSGTTTPGQPMSSVELADVVGFIQKVDDVSAGQNRGAWANELLSKLPANSLNTKQLNALDNYFNKGDRSVYNGS